MQTLNFWFYYLKEIEQKLSALEIKSISKGSSPSYKINEINKYHEFLSNINEEISIQWDPIMGMFDDLCINKIAPLFGVVLNSKEINQTLEEQLSFLDLENVWQWCEFYTPNRIDVNISRSHLFKEDNPIRLILDLKNSIYSVLKNKDIECFVERVGKKLATTLGIVVYYGNTPCTEKEDNLIIEKTFEPLQ